MSEDNDEEQSSLDQGPGDAFQTKEASKRRPRQNNAIEEDGRVSVWGYDGNPLKKQVIWQSATRRDGETHTFNVTKSKRKA